MSDTFDHNALPEDELLAAEYALGVLAGPVRIATERRIASERAFALLVAEWEERLAPWAAEIPEIVPEPQVWERVVAALPAPPPPPPPPVFDPVSVDVAVVVVFVSVTAGAVTLGWDLATS